MCAVTAVKAERLRIDCRRFPLAENVRLYRGRIQLTLNAVLRCLNDVNAGVTWQDALTKHINTRFLREEANPAHTQNIKHRRQHGDEVKQMLPRVVSDGKSWALREELHRMFVLPFKADGTRLASFGGAPQSNSSPPQLSPDDQLMLAAKLNAMAKNKVRLVGNEYVFGDPPDASAAAMIIDDYDDEDRRRFGTR